MLATLSSLKFKLEGRQTVKLAVVVILTLTLAADSQQKDAPAGQHSGMVERGDHAMGFSHERTTHHFRLFKDGGAIEVQTNDPAAYSAAAAVFALTAAAAGPACRR